MKTEKLKYLPRNLFYSLTSFFFPYLLIITWFTSVYSWVAIGISFYIYLTRVVHSCENDYMKERIAKLEKINELHLVEESRIKLESEK